jgi:uncharacterized protein YejL (UPF0352 family)
MRKSKYSDEQMAKILQLQELLVRPNASVTG